MIKINEDDADGGDEDRDEDLNSFDFHWTSDGFGSILIKTETFLAWGSLKRNKNLGPIGFKLDSKISKFKLSLNENSSRI